jgi:hypothetical protein
MSETSESGLSKPGLDGSGLPRLSLYLVAGGVLANAAFNLVMARLGHGYPYSSFLFLPWDRWADFFKLAFAYPLGTVQPAVFPGVLTDHVATMKVLADGLRGTAVNPDHMLPLATLMALVVRLAMIVVDPLLVFAACALLAIGSYAAVVKHMWPGPTQLGTWRAVAMFNYAFLFVADRGHMFAFTCAIALMTASWRMVRDRKLDWASIALLAIAANLRPNVLIVTAVLFLGLRIGHLRDYVRLTVCGLLLLILALVSARAIYPHYSLATWLAGMRDYSQLYIQHPMTSGFTSSLRSALDVLFGYHPAFGTLCLVLGGIVGLLTLGMARAGRLDESLVIFLALAIMPVALPAFGDYHLLPFLVPPMLLARKTTPLSPSDWVVYGASMLLLVPKNYVYGSDLETDPWSWQIVINPLIALTASAFVLFMALRPDVTAQRRPLRFACSLRAQFIR